MGKRGLSSDAYYHRGRAGLSTRGTSVEAITRNDAGAKNLRVTSTAVEEIIERRVRSNEKAIVFVTGVPGAGKTLVGLNVATRRREIGEARAVFLSGNGPLVAVLAGSADARRVSCRRARRKGVIRQKVKPFIQNIHHFRDEGYETRHAPSTTSSSSTRRRRLEPRKDRRLHEAAQEAGRLRALRVRSSWCRISTATGVGRDLCLVGGGQEIHTGEAGIGAWLEAMRDHFPRWKATSRRT